MICNLFSRILKRKGSGSSEFSGLKLGAQSPALAVDVSKCLWARYLTPNWFPTMVWMCMYGRMLTCSVKCLQWWSRLQCLKGSLFRVSWWSNDSSNPYVRLCNYFKAKLLQGKSVRKQPTLCRFGSLSTRVPQFRDAPVMRVTWMLCSFYLKNVVLLRFTSSVSIHWWKKHKSSLVQSSLLLMKNFSFFEYTCERCPATLNHFYFYSFETS